MVDSSVTVTGVTNVQDVASHTFISSGVHSSGIKVTDSNGTHLVLSGTASDSTVDINTSGDVVLEGTYNAPITVNTAGAQVTLAGTVTSTLTVDSSASAGTVVSLANNAVIPSGNLVLNGATSEDAAQLFEDPTLTVYSENVDTTWMGYAANTVFQANVNFKSGTTLADFMSVEIKLYHDDQLLATNTAKPAFFTGNATAIGVSDLFGLGDAAEPNADPNWVIGAYSPSLQPNKVVFTLIGTDNKVYTIEGSASF